MKRPQRKAQLQAPSCLAEPSKSLAISRYPDLHVSAGVRPRWFLLILWPFPTSNLHTCNPYKDCSNRVSVQNYPCQALLGGTAKTRKKPVLPWHFPSSLALSIIPVPLFLLSLISPHIWSHFYLQNHYRALLKPLLHSSAVIAKSKWIHREHFCNTFLWLVFIFCWENETQNMVQATKCLFSLPAKC